MCACISCNHGGFSAATAAASRSDTGTADAAARPLFRVAFADNARRCGSRSDHLSTCCGVVKRPKTT